MTYYQHRVCYMKYVYDDWSAESKYAIKKPVLPFKKNKQIMSTKFLDHCVSI